MTEAEAIDAMIESEYAKGEEIEAEVRERLAEILDKISTDIRDGIPHYVNKDGIFASIDDVQCIIDKYRKEVSK